MWCLHPCLDGQPIQYTVLKPHYYCSHSHLIVWVVLYTFWQIPLYPEQAGNKSEPFRRQPQRNIPQPDFDVYLTSSRSD